MVLELSTQALIEMQRVRRAVEQLLVITNEHHNLIHGRTPVFISNFDGWKMKQVGKSYFFDQLVTFTGTTMNINLILPFAFQLNRSEQIFSDATARDFEIQVYSDPSQTAYASLLNSAGNIATSVVAQRGSEYQYPANSKIIHYYANFTAGKTVRIRVQVTEL